ncbi:RES family NAD+ phosphorylase [Pectobacterium brasiliense]|uniref:RES family NAD+ phosphorylase n=1 Tax=Pectobacterium brasiliense TaxID=180957 RepID=UPI00069A878F|nr:RES family NAD+ phosphorylase [Pectobacterium brasiliense]MCG5050950.1 RES family NAD+ phosphorylase [Pectobacterium brasiliense]
MKNYDIEEEQEKNSAGILCPACIASVLYFNSKVKGLFKISNCMNCRKRVKEGVLLEDTVYSLSRNILNHYLISDNGVNIESKSLAEVLVTFGFNFPDVLPILAELIFKENKELNINAKYYNKITPEFIHSSTEEMILKWEKYAYELKHGKRYTNKEAASFYSSIITTCMGFDIQKKQPLKLAVTELSKGFIFYRARLVKNDTHLECIKTNPIKEIGAPPNEMASNNRMSPSGISFLYTSGDKDTCISELHPYVGDTIAIAEFSSTRNFCFFDFTLLENIVEREITLLDKPDSENFKIRYLIKKLHGLIAKPFRASDTSYIEIQAFSETIKNYGGFNFDGIIFQSSQNNKGINYVFFGDENYQHEVNESTNLYGKFSIELRKEIEIYSIEHLDLRKKLIK